jgi:hypothetical protein
MFDTQMLGKEGVMFGGYKHVPRCINIDNVRIYTQGL